VAAHSSVLEHVASVEIDEVRNLTGDSLVRMDVEGEIAGVANGDINVLGAVLSRDGPQIMGNNLWDDSLSDF
jgi:hypothetical protein